MSPRWQSRVAVALSICIAGSCTRPERLAPPAPASADKTVTIKATCDDLGVDFSLRPWTVHLKKGAKLNFVLDGASTAAEVAIQKQQAAWPYADQGYYKAMKQVPAQAAQMRDNVPLHHRFAYRVSLTCTAPNGRQHNVVVDPEVIIVSLTENDSDILPTDW